MARWLDKLLGRVPRVLDWDQLQLGVFEVEGVVRALEMITDPVGGTRCVALDYRAWPPSTTLGVDGAAVVGDRAFQVAATQTVEFMLEAFGRSVLIRPQPGEDVGAMHQALEAQYGFNLRTEVHCVSPGDEVIVRGKVVHVTPPGGSPHRSEPHRAVIEAQQIRRR
ncbi:MAG: hypothetical protein KUG77_00495 [Nannocystaceae bacterium]|nr:hypothetical protein [Nannocystaceae bacterium]